MDIIGAFQKLLTTASRIIHQKLRTGPIWGIRKNLITVGREPPDPSGESLFFRRWWRRSGPNLAATWRKRMPPPSWASRRSFVGWSGGGVVTGFRNGAFLFLGWKTRTTTTTTTAGAVTPWCARGRFKLFHSFPLPRSCTWNPRCTSGSEKSDASLEGSKNPPGLHQKF